MIHKARGFTIVELLVVIVVIGILATISVISYNNVAAKARDAQRLQDIKTISKALELYYLDNGRFPPSACGTSCPSPKSINSSWLTTSDGSWSLLEEALVPNYISALPKDPRAAVGTPAAIYNGYNYDYVLSTWCGAAHGRLFLLTYRLETMPRQNEISGNCASNAPSYASSQYVSVK